MTASRPPSRPAGISCGTDVVAIERIGDLIDRFGDSFLERVYTDSEVEYCRSRAVPEQHFAARWAAKEAAIKALPDVDPAITPSAVGTGRTDGTPQLELRGRAADALAGFDEVDTALSLSHDRTLGAAIAHVVVRASQQPRSDREAP